MSIRFDDRVAIVTGAGAGLGRAHALGLAERGARVVVNDFADPEAVVAEIEAAGGAAMADRGDVSKVADVTAMVEAAKAKWGRIDILVNNAGILRDKSFAKMSLEDVQKVLDVHLMGSTICTHAVWPIMREQGYGRVVFTSSASGLYGNFGQSNYGAAKAGMLGLMNVLHLEGAKYGIHVNMLAPTATTQMTEDLLPPDAAELLQPETITPGLLWLVSDHAPSRFILAAGGGCFARTRIYETRGICLTGDELTPEMVGELAHQISDPKGQEEIETAFTQTRNFARRAAEAKGLTLHWHEEK
ncbi:SDR family NAD(P)-dependent oxidoreductase [Acidimangrovimonas pyrenivorans]|uniref:SDR family NAD(P)-dependent oxidoreductase n=1 Tax=Acidimangrovimonas pyrenivorans TaxID=2030798 RepID=A0ABV7AD76_9RHOB